jgi:hypothetical protein
MVEPILFGSCGATIKRRIVPREQGKEILELFEEAPVL